MTENAIEKARKAAQSAAEKLAELEAAEQQKAAEKAAQRREREREWAKGFLSRWSELAREATKVDRTSDEYDPNTMGFLEGVIRFAAAREMRTAVLTEAERAEHVLEVPSNKTTVPQPRPYPLDITSHMEAIIKSEVRRRVAEFADKLEAEREEFVNGG
ncbi:hypothetical protein ACIO02_37610 [Streptomyces sp. NPDC087568]|uniref:hypothetical protein n=1 Tax=Streptomyces sp. NPDC087568 TaxID=3365799 RepID=UPI003824A69E